MDLIPFYWGNSVNHAESTAILNNSDQVGSYLLRLCEEDLVIREAFKK